MGGVCQAKPCLDVVCIYILLGCHVIHFYCFSFTCRSIDIINGTLTGVERTATVVLAFAGAISFFPAMMDEKKSFIFMKRILPLWLVIHDTYLILRKFS